MVVYHPNGSAAAIDFREMVPAAASIDMYHSNSSLSTKVSNVLHHCNRLPLRHYDIASL